MKRFFEKIVEFLKGCLSERGGEFSSIRLCLVSLVALILGISVFVVVRHAVDHISDIPKNLADLLATISGVLTGGKTVQRFAENGSPQ
jgi:hypothetical protein